VAGRELMALAAGAAGHLGDPGPKHEPRSLAEQRAALHVQAAETLGEADAVKAMITHALNPASSPSPAVDAEWVTATAEKVLAAVEEHRSTW
jgi:hypothetical protein